MSNGKIKVLNPRIIEIIKQNCGKDKVISKFLIDLLYEEFEHSGQWWWAETYKDRIKTYSARWSSPNED
ncbi:MAG: hypothetical protein E3J71_09640 [Candidatus Stahlbacteria bacterium]|nr:MAG: hypothetical protein E3J71_09640 [Candidatus Stahlbacteria bacterium]